MAGIVIIGGKLQGAEAAYLGKEAGIEITLIDLDPQAPAQNLCTNFICGDVLSDNPAITAALDAADMILPTMENDAVLEKLSRICAERGYVFAFDIEAYRISSSKKISDKLFADNALPCPRYYPKGRLPYIAKPDSGSGSHGIKHFEDTEAGAEAFREFLHCNSGEYIIQEFVSGSSYSVEIIGYPGNYRTYEVTQIFVDDGYDCNLAAVYRNIEPEKKTAINKYIRKIAELTGLKGIMDIEVIDTCRGDETDELGIKILEIDARLPSQTSVAVYHATGMNYIKELYDLFVTGDFREPMTDKGAFSSYYQYMVGPDGVQRLGEHIMVEGGVLNYDNSMMPAANSVNDKASGLEEWRGIFVSWADTFEELKEKEETVWQSIR